MRFVWSFLVLTLRAPGTAARSILLRQWPDEAIWTGLFLAITLNALFFGVLAMLLPASAELAGVQMVPGISGLSLFTAALRSLGFAALVTFGGRMIGGSGRFMPILALLVWYQLVQLVVLGLALLVLQLSPMLGMVAVLVVGIAMFFVLLNFVNEAHGFASLWHAFAVILMATILLFFAMIFLAGLLGPAILGLPENV
ncbi:YIP1 family protein [Pseudophaeobacter profundi]|uniref:YIP1 family protein n=1 Tax=Pseudophaeobacter profundi TaxID=3034152 RepID=UPI00242F4E5D|nr:YIP1 family protein [Pseudophaeobacter profundi]